ncbi:MAG: dihydroneopterin aldolase [Gammaproteobacteria bacterium]|nr:dihydroneopterin aldolase [Chromatiales bacterium]MCP4925270.1 dihydroneopterin aldolase [Gammaproteobacteria bacterium]MDP7093924.1 dihydroneopterin aldolase [Gammaproteobacteria bacterium]MDP7296263.1 dihydroneopterin aldolase [Gammaproteobacteria bacterium]MDP7418279.1 dihydroneopterin aldolase [Gammaproteobacteria bacterium]
MDRIFVTDLRVDAIVGIWDWERAMTQSVSIDLEMAWDISRAAETDDISTTLDYRAVSKRVAASIKESRFRLIETMAEHIAELIQQEFGVTWLRVSICKPSAVRGSREVGVRIERGTV